MEEDVLHGDMAKLVAQTLANYLRIFPLSL
jgi:hypothetical protein